MTAAVRYLPFVLRAYLAGVLVVGIAFSSPGPASLAIVLLVWHLLRWRWPARPFVELLVACFTFFTVAVLPAAGIGPVAAVVISLPLLLFVHRALERVAETVRFHETGDGRRPTNLALSLLVSGVVVFLAGLLLASPALAGAAVALLVYLASVWWFVIRRLSLQPVTAVPVQWRVVAGSEGSREVDLVVETTIGSRLFLAATDEGVTLQPNVLSLDVERLSVRLRVAPELAGPSPVRLVAYATDRWGLTQVRFELEPARLFVIPRARYAAWLAERYLTATKPGSLPLTSNVAALRPTYGFRRGIEYYGSQQYQPGDSLKNIDWKHSFKENSLITKEFAEFRGQSALILVNLAVADAEEADKVAYRIIVTALSLAREGVPAALAAYDEESVHRTTATLAPRHLVVEALGVAREIVVGTKPVRYLAPPDVGRLRANMKRVGVAGGTAARVLGDLMRAEYRSLEEDARSNPATRALRATLAKAGRQSTVVTISGLNHDAAALAFDAFYLRRRGMAVISA